MKNLKNFSDWRLILEAESFSTLIRNKSAVDYQRERALLNQPESGPIKSILDSAKANLDVPTRKIPGTENGNVGCAAAVSIIFYRATGLDIRKGVTIELSTSSLWSYFTVDKDNWEIILDWRNSHKPGDIILTSRGKQAGHVGVVIEGGNIISNSSGGFNGDKPGQIEQNYTIRAWESVAKRNPQQTALFRYKGPFLDTWGGKPIYISKDNDQKEIEMAKELPEIVIVSKEKGGVVKKFIEYLKTKLNPEDIVLDDDGEPDLKKSEEKKLGIKGIISKVKSVGDSLKGKRY